MPTGTLPVSHPPTPADRAEAGGEINDLDPAGDPGCRARAGCTKILDGQAGAPDESRFSNDRCYPRRRVRCPAARRPGGFCYTGGGATPAIHGGRPAHRVNLTSTTTFLPLSAMGTRVKERMIGTGFGLIGIPSPGPRCMNAEAAEGDGPRSKEDAMDEQPKIPLELQRRIDRRWAARFKAPQQQSKDRRLEMAERSGKETICEQAATCKGAA